MMIRKLKTRSEFARMAGVAPASITKACGKSLAKACVRKKIDANHPDAVKYLLKKEEEEILASGIDPKYEEVVRYAIENEIFIKTQLSRKMGISLPRIKKIVDSMKVNGIVPGPKQPMPVLVEVPQQQKIVVAEVAQQPLKAPRIIKGQTKHVMTKKAEALANLNENIEDGQTLHEIPDDIVKFADMTLRELIQRFGSDTAFLDWLKATKAIEEINEKRLKNAQTKGELVSRELVKRGIIEPIDTAHIKLLTDGSKAMSVRASALVKAGEPIEVVEKYIAEQITSFIRPVKTKVKRALKDI